MASDTLLTWAPTIGLSSDEQVWQQGHIVGAFFPFRVIQYEIQESHSGGTLSDV